MRLEGLHVREARGLPDGLRAGFDGAELVLVHGPNGIGKSSLVRVVRSLLWPKSASGEDRAEATWRTGGRSLRARLDRGEVTWTREGRPCEAPRLPDASLAGNYVLELRSLLRDSEEGFAARMRRELYGGIDIDAVERARPAPKRTERGTREKELAKAQAEVRHVTEKLAKGDASERRQKELERELAREGADEALLKRIELEQQHRAEEARREELAARLAEFPKRMETIQAGDTEEAREFETKVQQARSAKTQAERELVASRQEFERRGGGPDWREAVEGSALPTLETIRARLQAFKDAHRDACDRESPARVAAGEAGLAGPEEALGIDEAEGEGSTELADLEGVLREHARLEAKLDGLRIQLAVLGEEGEVEDGAGIEGAIPTLRRWLRVPDAVPGDSSGRRRMAFAMLGVGLAAAAVGGIAPWDWLLSAGLVLVACSGLVWWFGRGSSKGFDPEEVRRQIQQEFARLGIDGPEAWTPEGVERLLLSLECRRAELQDARVRADKQSAERARLHASIKNVEGALESNRTRREELLGRHGLDLEHTLDAAVALRKLEDARASRRAARKEALAWR
ncbi:MAG TPA: hypothetical protein ENI87_14070, partial [bacterium]|nr:hypothetical protein [bacterium]